jgi:general secretion pathway protein J
VTGPSRHGFTLVEVLIALLVFALIAAAGAALLSAAANARDAVKDSADRLAALQRTRSLLAADLGQAAPRRVRNADGRAEPQAFASGAEAEGALLRLTRTGWINPGDHPRASLQQVEYRLVDGRLERRFFARLDGARPEPVQVLLTDVRAAHVTFLSEGREDGVWRATPDRPMPEAVRITLTLPTYGVVSQLFLVDR